MGEKRIQLMVLVLDRLLRARLRVVLKRYSFIRIKEHFAVGPLVSQRVVVADIAGDLPRSVLPRVRKQNGNSTVGQSASRVCNSQPLIKYAAKKCKVAALASVCR